MWDSKLSKAKLQFWMEIEVQTHMLITLPHRWNKEDNKTGGKPYFAYFNIVYISQKQYLKLQLFNSQSSLTSSWHILNLQWIVYRIYLWLFQAIIHTTRNEHFMVYIKLNKVLHSFSIFPYVYFIKFIYIKCFYSIIIIFLSVFLSFGTFWAEFYYTG